MDEIIKDKEEVKIDKQIYTAKDLSIISDFDIQSIRRMLNKNKIKNQKVKIRGRKKYKVYKSDLKEYMKVDDIEKYLENDTFKFTQVSVMLNLNKYKLQKEIKQGNINAARFGNTYLFVAQDINDYISKHQFTSIDNG